MKQTKIICGMIAAAFVLALIGFASADIIEPDTHYVKKCVSIDYSSENLVLIGYITGPGADWGDMENPYIVESGKCLEKGYKFNRFNLYWATRSYVDSVDITKINITNNENVHYVNISVEPYGGYVADSNPLIAENITYKICGFDGENLTLFQSKAIQKFNNGGSDIMSVGDCYHDFKKTVRHVCYNNDNCQYGTCKQGGCLEMPPNPPAPEPQPVKRGFFARIGCFFKALFGSPCCPDRLCNLG